MTHTDSTRCASAARRLCTIRCIWPSASIQGLRPSHDTPDARPDSRGITQGTARACTAYDNLADSSASESSKVDAVTFVVHAVRLLSRVGASASRPRATAACRYRLNGTCFVSFKRCEKTDAPSRLLCGDYTRATRSSVSPRSLNSGDDAPEPQPARPVPGEGIHDHVLCVLAR